MQLKTFNFIYFLLFFSYCFHLFMIEGFSFSLTCILTATERIIHSRTKGSVHEILSNSPGGQETQ